MKNCEFQTLDEFFEFYNNYAFEAGFSVRRSLREQSRDGTEIVRQELCCHKEGHSKKLKAQPKRRKGIIRKGCLAKVTVVKRSGVYVVSQFIEGHNHPLTSPPRVHLLKSHRGISHATRCLTMELRVVNIPTHQQISLLEVQSRGIENMGCMGKDIYNYERDKRNELKGHVGDMLYAHFLSQQENPFFTFKIEEDETTEEFDKKWKKVVESSNLSDNGWLQSIYDIRASWVPAYCNHIFSTGMSSSQCAESCHSFFKKFQIIKDDEYQSVYLVKKRSDQIQKDREIVYDKVQEVDYLPQQYILNRWTKAAKSAAVKDLGGLEITDTNALVVKRSKLFHHASLLIDKVLTSPDEGSTIFIEALDNVFNKLKEMQVDKGESACVRKKPSDVFQHRYNEPNQVRAKGCGKRLKKGKGRKRER
ncbi:hypothetical protein M0R45_035643 [Rubus argutus]|uniref:FAR1 domain-containing protein n=1 Tax=Rubus argutus TaxID=59490 RepID=A0AAW1VY70_RUBAR